jgi:hypothetical protein
MGRQMPVKSGPSAFGEIPIHGRRLIPKRLASSCSRPLKNAIEVGAAERRNRRSEFHCLALTVTRQQKPAAQASTSRLVIETALVEGSLGTVGRASLSAAGSTGTGPDATGIANAVRTATAAGGCGGNTASDTGCTQSKVTSTLRQAARQTQHTTRGDKNVQVRAMTQASPSAIVPCHAARHRLAAQTSAHGSIKSNQSCMAIPPVRAIRYA